MNFDLIIVGAGMTGSSLALSLVDSKLRIALVDQAALPCPAQQGPQARVVAINHSSQQFLSALKAWPKQHCTPYFGMQVWDQDGSAQLQLSLAESQCQGHIVGNQSLVHSLHEALNQQRSITLFDSTEVKAWQPGQIQLHSNELLQAPLIVAADGSQSLLRQWAGFEVQQWSYEQEALVALVQTQHPHGQRCHQAFTEQGPVALLPVDDERLTALVWSHDLGLGYKYLDQVDFEAKLQQSFGHRLGQLRLASPSQALPLKARHAKQYYRQGVLLLGDAAHSIHPLAGQGVNLGLADTQALSLLLRQAQAADCPLNHPQLMARFERQRRAANWQMLAAMEVFKRGFGSSNPYVRSLRNQAFGLVEHTSWLKSWLINQAS